MGLFDIPEWDEWYDLDEDFQQEEQGIVINDHALVDVYYTSPAETNSWIVTSGAEYPIISRSGDIVKFKDIVSGDIITVRISKDRRFKKNIYGEPVHITVIKRES